MLHPHRVNCPYAGFLCLLCCCALPVDGYTAFDVEDTDARTVALGGGCVADWEDAGTVGLNPAGIACGEHVRISLTHLRLLPELKDDLDVSAAGGVFPSRWGAFGVGASLFGALFERGTYLGVLDLSLCDDTMKISGGIERAFPGIVEMFLRIGGAGTPGDGDGKADG